MLSMKQGQRGAENRAAPIRMSPSSDRLPNKPVVKNLNSLTGPRGNFYSSPLNFYSIFRQLYLQFPVNFISIFQSTLSPISSQLYLQFPVNFSSIFQSTLSPISSQLFLHFPVNFISIFQSTFTRLLINLYPNNSSSHLTLSSTQLPPLRSVRL